MDPGSQSLEIPPIAFSRARTGAGSQEPRHLATQWVTSCGPHGSVPSGMFCSLRVMSQMKRRQGSSVGSVSKPTRGGCTMLPPLQVVLSHARAVAGSHWQVQMWLEQESRGPEQPLPGSLLAADQGHCRLLGASSRNSWGGPDPGRGDVGVRDGLFPVRQSSFRAYHCAQAGEVWKR